MTQETKYLLLVIQLEGEATVEIHNSLEEAKESFKNETSTNASEYNIGVALYDFNKSTRFSRGSYGFDGDPIEEWENPNY
jgi:hypothetical protein